MNEEALKSNGTFKPTGKQSQAGDLPSQITDDKNPVDDTTPKSRIAK